MVAKSSESVYEIKAVAGSAVRGEEMRAKRHEQKKREVLVSRCSSSKEFNK